MKNKKGFTLAETLITLTILGVIAAITIPGVVRRQIEAADRAKIKKLMKIFDLGMNNVVIEKGIKNRTALQSLSCDEITSYFVYSSNIDNNNCKIKFKDGTACDFTNVLTPLCAVNENSLNQDGIDKNKAFNFTLDIDNNGSLRINDLAYETLRNDEQRLNMAKRLWAFVKNEKDKETTTQTPKFSDICKTDESLNCTTASFPPRTETYCVYDENWDEISCENESKTDGGEFTVAEIGLGYDIFQPEEAKSDENCATSTYPDCKTNGDYHNAAKRYCESKGARLPKIAELLSMQEAGTLPCASGYCTFWAAEEAGTHFSSLVNSDYGDMGSFYKRYNDPHVLCIGD